MEHNQNQQKFWFFVEYQDWPCTCFPFIDHSPTPVAAVFSQIPDDDPPFLMIDTTFFVEETDQKNVDFNSEHWVETPQKRVISPNQVGDWGWPMKLLPYVAIIFPHPKQLFAEKSQDLFHLPLFTMAFLGFPMIFLRSTMVFQWDFADRVPESRASRALKNGFEAGFEKRPTLQLGMSLASGTQLHRHEARLRWDALWWMVVFFLVFCAKNDGHVVEQQWDKPWNVLKCWEMGYDCSQLLGL